MKVLEFLKDFNIPYSLTHHHRSIGWVMLQNCPFCGSNNFHLGVNLEHGGVNCWICGKHTQLNLVKNLPNCVEHHPYKILKEYFSKDQFADLVFTKRIKVKTIAPCKFPAGTEEIQQRHKDYLLNRNFDPNLIVKNWNIKGTGIIGDYRFRIIVPITYQNIMVSYTARDITNKAAIRYKTCRRTEETKPHKHCLYGLEKVKNNRVVVVEGVTDVWRLGFGAVATLGITWTIEQAVQLLKMKTVFILYDSQPKAQEQADKLAYLLAPNIKNTEILELQLSEGKDPADLSQNDATILMRDLGITSSL